MDAIDYKKPITFRPSERDREVLELLAAHNPVLSANSADLLRMALQSYLLNADRLTLVEKALADLTARLNLISPANGHYVVELLSPADNKALSAQEEEG